MNIDPDLDAVGRRLALALKAPPPRPLSGAFTSRVVATARPRTVFTRSERGPFERMAEWVLRPRLVLFRPAWTLAAVAIVLALGVGLREQLSVIPAGTPKILVRFAVRAPSAQTVSVAGDFNGWATEDVQMADPEGDGVWQAVVPLTPGVYQYMFVLDGETWIPDPLEGERIDDGFGQQNSLVRVAGMDAAGGGYRAL